MADDEIAHTVYNSHGSCFTVGDTTADLLVSSEEQLQPQLQQQQHHHQLLVNGLIDMDENCNPSNNIFGIETSTHLMKEMMDASASASTYLQQQVRPYNQIQSYLGGPSTSIAQQMQDFECLYGHPVDLQNETGNLIFPTPSYAFPMTEIDPTIHLTGHLGSLPQPPLLAELLHSPISLFSSYGGEGNGGVLPNQLNGYGCVYGHGELCMEGLRDYSMEVSGNSRDKRRGENLTDALHFVSEKERRTHMKEKFTVLRSLIPNPTKNDRASIVGDAIEYIKELMRTVDDLNSLIEKKRCAMERRKRQKIDEDDDSKKVQGRIIPSTPSPNDSGQSSYSKGAWIKRKSKVADVDVGIIDDDVTIKIKLKLKLTERQRKERNNCLLYVSRVLDELQLDLHHVAGGHIGDYCSFLLNTKIYQGSSAFPDAVANRLIQVLDHGQNAKDHSSSDRDQC